MEPQIVDALNERLAQATVQFRQDEVGRFMALQLLELARLGDALEGVLLAVQDQRPAGQARDVELAGLATGQADHDNRLDALANGRAEHEQRLRRLEARCERFLAFQAKDHAAIAGALRRLAALEKRLQGP